MENLRAYLSNHGGLRVALICLAFFSASLALYLGAFICAFMNSPVASMHPSRDRSIATVYLITALVLNVLMVWAMGCPALELLGTMWSQHWRQRWRCGVNVCPDLGPVPSSRTGDQELLEI